MKLKCIKCGHEWRPRVDDVVMCPKCKTHKWKEEDQKAKELEEAFNSR